MTRNNLQLHIGWLLSEKPSFPPPPPQLSASFDSNPASSRTLSPDRALVPRTESVTSTIDRSHPSPQRVHSTNGARPPQHQTISRTQQLVNCNPPLDNDMAKLRIAAGSASKARLLTQDKAAGRGREGARNTPVNAGKFQLDITLTLVNGIH